MTYQTTLISEIRTLRKAMEALSKHERTKKKLKIKNKNFLNARGSVNIGYVGNELDQRGVDEQIISEVRESNGRR